MRFFLSVAKEMAKAFRLQLCGVKNIKMIASFEFRREISFCGRGEPVISCDDSKADRIRCELGISGLSR